MSTNHWEHKESIWNRLVRFGFRLLYNELSWSYDAVSWIVSLGRWRQWQKTALPFLIGYRVLEIAHGPGHLLIALGESGYQVFGLDLSREMIMQAQRRFKDREIVVPLVQGNALELPYKSHFFDSVLMTFPTEFVLDSGAISGVNRILRNGGRWIILLDARLTDRGPVHRIIDWLFKITGQRDLSHEAKSPEARRQPFIDLLEKFGFLVQLQAVEDEDSEVIIILADKPH